MPSRTMKPIHIHWVRVLPLFVIFFIFALIIYTLTRSSSCSSNYSEDTDVKAISYLCNALHEGPANGHEGSVPTFKYRLEQVHVTIRHGDRFHLHTLPNYDMIPISCNITSDIIRHVPEMEGYVSTLRESAKRMSPRHPFLNWELYPNRSACKPTFLTPTGAAQHVRNGAFLKSVYVRKWKLLSHGSELWEQVQMVTTKKGRTLQSGLALLYGLLPDFDLGQLNIAATADNRMCLPNADCDCPAIQRFKNVVSGVYGQWLPGFAAQQNVRQYTREVAEVLGTPEHTLPPASHLMDVAVVHMCHGLPLPGPPGRSRCLAPATVRAIVEAINRNGAVRIHDPKVQRLSHLKMHPMLAGMLGHMKAVMTTGNRRHRRFVLYSGHDSTIDPLALVLNVTDGSWPRYASRIVIELYSSAASAPPVGPAPGAAAGAAGGGGGGGGGGASSEAREYFVKVIYDGRDVTPVTAGCRQLAPDGLCRFADFKAAIDGDGIRKWLDGKTYKEACSKAVP